MDLHTCAALCTNTRNLIMKTGSTTMTLLKMMTQMIMLTMMMLMMDWFRT